MPPRTLYDKIWDAHVVSETDGEAILCIDVFENKRAISQPWLEA